LPNLRELVGSFADVVRIPPQRWAWSYVGHVKPSPDLGVIAAAMAGSASQASALVIVMQIESAVRPGLRISCIGGRQFSVASSYAVRMQTDPTSLTPCAHR
jgi:hypothetical protein